jgi:hypothetical protein
MTRLLCVAGLLACFGVSAVSAQTPPAGAAASLRRPWVSVAVGWGAVSTTAGASHGGGLLGASVDLPFAHDASIRAGAERIWGRDDRYGRLSLRQVTAELVLRRTLSFVGQCFQQSPDLLGGIGGGLFVYTLGDEPLADATRLGYQLSLGFECPDDRLVFGFGVTARFLDPPEHPAFAVSPSLVPSLAFYLRVRL